MLAQRVFASALLLVCAGLAAMAWPYQAAFSYEPVGQGFTIQFGVIFAVYDG